MTKPRIKDEDLNLNLKTPAELKEEFERMDYHEQNDLLKNYELFGLEVIKQQGKAYKSLYEAYKGEKNKVKSDSFWYSMLAIEHWFESNLGKYCVTDISAEDLCKRMRSEIDKRGKKNGRA